MAEIKQEETQQELFGEFSGEPKKANRFPSLHKTQKPILVSTSVEQLILVSILLILAGCLVFFLGILRGRALSSAPASADRLLARPRMESASTTRMAAPQVLTRSSLDSVKTPATAIRSSVMAPLNKKEEKLDTSKPYTIQLATYKRQDWAEKEVAALNKGGFFAFVIPSGDYYQVCVGQYASKEEAKRKLKFFSSKYKDSYLRRR